MERQISGLIPAMLTLEDAQKCPDFFPLTTKQMHHVTSRIPFCRLIGLRTAVSPQGAALPRDPRREFSDVALDGRIWGAWCLLTSPGISLPASGVTRPGAAPQQCAAFNRTGSPYLQCKIRDLHMAGRYLCICDVGCSHLRVRCKLDNNQAPPALMGTYLIACPGTCTDVPRHLRQRHPNFKKCGGQPS